MAVILSPMGQRYESIKERGKKQLVRLHCFFYVYELTDKFRTDPKGVC